MAPAFDPPWKFDPYQNPKSVSWGTSPGVLAIWVAMGTGIPIPEVIIPLTATEKAVPKSFDLMQNLPVLASPYTLKDIADLDVWRQDSPQIEALPTTGFGGIGPGLVHFYNTVAFVNIAKFTNGAKTVDFKIGIPNRPLGSGSSYEWEVKAATFKPETPKFPAMLPTDLADNPNPLITQAWIQSGVSNFFLNDLFSAVPPVTVTLTVRFKDLNLTGSVV